MPSYNQVRYLEAAIESVLSQNYPNLEFLIYDGGSCDGSVRVIEKYSSYVDYWQSEQDDGQASVLRAGFERATGDIFCWLNSDDILLPGCIWRIAKLFRKYPRVDFFYGDRRVIDEHGVDQGSHRWPTILTSYHWSLGQPLAQECCFWRSDLYRKVGGVNSELYFIMDYDLFYRMWLVGRFKKVSAYIGCIRNHDESKNTKARNIWQKELSEAVTRFKLKKPGYLALRFLHYFDRLQLKLEILLTRHYP